jgi:hypothetical protein
MSEPSLSPTASSTLRKRIIRSLKEQGFNVENGKLSPPRKLSKKRARSLHETAVEHKIARAKSGLVHKEKRLLQRIASGFEIDPSKMNPRLVEVLPDSEDELLFRYASLHWSIPVSAGYGRRLRFLVVDEHNNKLIGLIGLGDPIYNLGPRDIWIGWTASHRKKRLRHVMDAFVLGAVPPYSFFLCGKLVAMLATSETVRIAFARKYGGQNSLIRRKKHDGRLALITTTSALGRSSIYNRLRYGKRRLFESVGFTKGSGEFHFSNGLYAAIANFATDKCEPTERQSQWGKGFRNRRETLRKSLSALRLPRSWLQHGIEREVFVIPLAENVRQFLRGDHTKLRWFHQTETEIFEFFRERWMVPRLRWDQRYRSWSRDQWAIWFPRAK